MSLQRYGSWWMNCTERRAFKIIFHKVIVPKICSKTLLLKRLKLKVCERRMYTLQCPLVPFFRLDAKAKESFWNILGGVFFPPTLLLQEVRLSFSRCLQFWKTNTCFLSLCTYATTYYMCLLECCLHFLFLRFSLPCTVSDKDSESHKNAACNCALTLDE